MALGLLLVCSLILPAKGVARGADRGSAWTPAIAALKVLSFVQNLDEVTNGSCVIGVLYEHADSKTRAEAAVRTMRRIGAKSKLQGMKIEVLPVAIAKATDIPASVSVFVIMGELSDWKGVLTESHRRRAPTLALERRFVERGAALGIVDSGKGQRVLIRVRAAKKLGLKIGSGFLRLAELI